MLEIKKILQANKLDFLDKSPNWGAKLSHYQSHLNKSDVTYIGIELEEDCPSPTHYISIDHHNERSSEPSSIEQIASLLGITLSYYQQLIAANDKGYIPAMQAIGATWEEIQEIRLADRKAQGVTDEMETQAQKDLENIFYKKGVAIVQTTLERFSPITDRLQEKHLIIYNTDSLNYYGPFSQQLASHYSSLTEQGKAYSGGGKNGFFGLASGFYTLDEIKEFVNQIIEVI